MNREALMGNKYLKSTFLRQSSKNPLSGRQKILKKQQLPFYALMWISGDKDKPGVVWNP